MTQKGASFEGGPEQKKVLQKVHTVGPAALLRGLFDPAEPSGSGRQGCCVGPFAGPHRKLSVGP